MFQLKCKLELRSISALSRNKSLPKHNREAPSRHLPPSDEVSSRRLPHPPQYVEEVQELRRQCRQLSESKERYKARVAHHEALAATQAPAPDADGHGHGRAPGDGGGESVGGTGHPSPQ